jgi:hypothetical protein
MVPLLSLRHHQHFQPARRRLVCRRSESGTLFAALFEDATTTKHPAPKDQLTLHADRGGSMRAKATALLLADLGVTKSHSRPHTSNDNPFSESHFKTMKHQPQFPQQFGRIQDAKIFCRCFLDWYNRDHHHAGIGLMTPDQMHYGLADQVHAARQVTLDGAFSRNPERFVRKESEPPAKPIATWINPPSPANRSSLNTKCHCLRIVDTFRWGPPRPSLLPLKLNPRLLLEHFAAIGDALLAGDVSVVQGCCS